VISQKTYDYSCAISFHEIYFFFTVSSLRITTRTQLPLVKSRERGTDLIDELFGQQEDKAANLAGDNFAVCQDKIIRIGEIRDLRGSSTSTWIRQAKNVTGLDLLKKFDLRMLINQKRAKNLKNQRTTGKYGESGISVFSVIQILRETN